MRTRELVEKCRNLEAQVRERRLATDAELAEYRPKSRPKGRTPDFRWVFWYGQLIRFCGRLETREPAIAEADAVVIAALRGEAREVKLSDQVAIQGVFHWMRELVGALPNTEALVSLLDQATDIGPVPVASVWVFPKSFEALLNIHVRDQLITWLATRYAVIRQTTNGADAIALLERLATELAYQQHLMAWAATTPGLGLPFQVMDDRPEPPAVVRAFGPWDLVRIHQAFIDVNATSLQALEKLIQPTRDDQGQGRPSWSVFIGTMALKWRMDPVRLMRDYALISLLATAKIATLAGLDASSAEDAA